MKTRTTAPHTVSKRWLSLFAGLSLALGLLLFCYFAFVTANGNPQPAAAVAEQATIPVYGLLDVTPVPTVTAEHPVSDADIVPLPETETEAVSSAVVADPVATVEPTLPVSVLSQDTGWSVDALPFEPNGVIEQARNQVQFTEEGVPYVAQTGHQAEFAQGGLTFTALPETPAVSEPAADAATPDLAAAPALSVELASITIGATTLADNQPQPSPEVQGNVVRFDRGQGLVEEFIARDAGVEQRWWLEEKPAANGDLTITVEVQTALDLEANEAGFVFRMLDQITGEMIPAIRYARPLAIDTDQQTMWGQTDSQLVETTPDDLHRYHLIFTFPADWLEHAQYPLLVDPLVSGLLRLEQGSPAQSQQNIQITYNPDDNEFLLVWQDYRNGNNWDIYAQRLDGDGALLGDNFVINSSAYHQDVPHVMYAPDQDRYLVAWRHYTSASQYDVYGQRLSGTGDFVGSAFAIATGPASTLQTPTDIVYNSQSNQFLVLWQDGRNGKLTIWGRHVSLTGSLGSEFQITSVTSTDQRAGVGAYNAANNQYLVVWATSDSKILARRMTGSGVVTTTDTILLSSNTSIDTPDVVYLDSTTQYLAVWKDNRNVVTTGSDIYGRLVTPSGTTNGSEFVISNHSASETVPRLTLSASGGAWVVWQRNNGATTGQDIYARELNSSGQPIGSLITVYESPYNPGVELGLSQERPVAARNSLGDLVFAWQDDRVGNWDVYARLRLANGNIGGDFLTHPASGNQENVHIAFNTTANEYLVVWQDFRGDLLQWQIYGQRVSGTGTLIGNNILINGFGTNPHVAYASNSNDYLVVWSYNNNVWGQRLTAGGSLSGSPYMIFTGLVKGSIVEQPAVVYSPVSNLFLVVAALSQPGTNPIYSIIARQTPGSYTIVTLTTQGGKEPEVAVASDGTYLVVWEDWRNSTRDVYAHRLTSSGSLNGSEFVIVNSSWDDRVPSVAWNASASAYLVVWQSTYIVSLNEIHSKIEGQRVNTSGALVGTPLTLASTENYGELYQTVARPSVTVSDAKWLVVWPKQENNPLIDILAQTVRSDGLLLGEPANLVVADGSQKNPVVAGGGQDYALLAWQDSRVVAWDLYAALYQMDVSVAGLTAANSSPTPLGNSTFFTASIVTGTNVVYFWDFGDNNSGAGITATHTYTQAGIYTATVTATNSDNLLTASTVVTIYQPAVADFVGTPVSGTVPLSVTFTNSSTFATSYLWQFGDGAISTAISPTHVYTQTGIYTVTLWASNPYSSDVLTRSAYITVFDNNPSVIIVKEGPAIVEAGEPITYTLTVTNNGQYNLSNLVITDTLPAGANYVSGGTLVGQTVRWTFSSLSVGHSLSVSFVITANSVVINDRYAVTASGGLYATGEPVITVIGEPWGGYWWDDTFFYRRPLTLTTGNVITSGPGITNTVAFTITTSTLISDGKLQIDGDDLHVLYRDILGWHVLLTQISSVVSPTAVITFPLTNGLPDTEGTYWLYYGNAIAGPGPELVAPDVTAGQVITNVTGSGTITPTVTFFADPRLAWVGQSISFTNYVTPVAVIDTFTWNFGDGITSTISNTSHLYSALGVYTVTLTVTTTEGLVVTYGYTNYITILADQHSVVTVTVGDEEEPVVITTLTAGQPGEAQSAMGDFFVAFPAGAITQTLIITHTPFQAEVQQNAGVMKRFALDAATTTGQAVTQFGQPLQLVLDLEAWNMTPAEMETVVFFYWDETEDEWLPLPTTVDTAHGVALAMSDHFSDFAAASNYGLGGPPALRRLPSVSEGGVDLLTGSSTYVYPLEVSPGTHGMQPNLSLVYNSGAADTLLDQQAGMVGHGFELAGLGWVQYEPKKEEYYLNLNGVSERLIPETGNPTIFHTEHETFWRIELLTGGENGIGDAPYWLVTTQDGTQFRFGYKAYSATYYLERLTSFFPQIYRFELDQIADIYGNTISIRYEEQDAIHRFSYPLEETYEAASWPVVITYTQNISTGLEATRLITFTYGQPGLVNEQQVRADMPSNEDIGPGQRYGYPTALIKMSAWVDPDGAGAAPFDLVRTYAFSYTYFTQNGEPVSNYGPALYHLMLTGITEAGTDNSVLPTTVFSYTVTGHLELIDNGYGGQTTYTYEKIGEKDIAKNVRSWFGGTWIEYVNSHEPDADRWRVVTKEIRDDSQIISTYYDYSPVLFREGGFRGHQEVSVTTSDSTAETITRFSLGYYYTLPMPPTSQTYDDVSHEPLWGRPYEVTVKENGIVLSRMETVYSVRWVTGDSFAIVPIAAVASLGNESEAILTTYNYDLYGNMTYVQEHGDPSTGADNRLTTMTYQSPDGNDRYVTNRPLEIIIKSYTGVVIARTSFTYTVFQDTNAVATITTTQWDESGHNSPDLVQIVVFDEIGNVSATWTGAAQYATTFSYDSVFQTFPVTISYPEGLSEAFVYDARFGIVRVMTDTNGLVMTNQVDAFGRVITATGAGGATIYDYFVEGDSGLRVMEKHLGGLGPFDDQYGYLYYNGLGQLSHILSQDENGSLVAKTRYGYDSLGRLITSTIPFTGTEASRVLATSYDALGRPLTVETLDGVTTYDYQSWHTVVITNALNQRRIYQMDAYGRLTHAIEFSGTLPVVTTYQYDILGNLTSVYDPEYNQTTMVYDSLGRKLEMHDPNAGVWHYTYNNRGLLATQQDARGITTTLIYDDLGRVITKTYTIPAGSSVAPTAPVTYSYEGSLLTGMQDGSGQTIWEYDTAGRLLVETKVISGQTFLTAYSYDALGRLFTMTYPDGEVVTYTYNIAGQVTQMGGDDVYLTDASYNLLHQPTVWSLGNGVVQATQYYTTSFRPEGVTALLNGITATQDLDFMYDSLGRLVYWRDNNTLYTFPQMYDDLGRLKAVNASYAPFVQVYGYDLLGNLESRSGPTNMMFTSWTRPNLPGSDANGTTYTYDANGNLVRREMQSGQVISYTYDAENRLTQVVSVTLGSGDGLTTTFIYDGHSQRVLTIQPDGRYLRYVGEIYVNDGESGDQGIQVVTLEGFPGGNGSTWNGCLVLDQDGNPYFAVKGDDATHLYFYVQGNITLLAQGAFGHIDSSLAIDNNEIIHIVWTAYTGVGTEQKLYYAYSIDYGNTWSAPEVLATTSEPLGEPKMSIATDGKIHVIWFGRIWQSGGWNYQLYHRYRDTDTGIWSSIVTVTESPETVHIVDQYDLAVDMSGGLVALWSGSQNTIYMKHWINNAWTATETVVTHQLPDLAHIVATVGNDGTVHVAWNDVDGLYYRFKDSEGWSSIELVAVNGVRPSIRTLENMPIIAWLTGNTASYSLRTDAQGWINYTLAQTQSSGEPRGNTHCMFEYSSEFGGNLIWNWGISTQYAHWFASANVTKRYFAGDQQVATRVDDELFYHLNDPSGTSLTMTDAEGDTAWQVVYDGYGAVLTSTRPVTDTLMQTLLGVPDAASKLVYQGNGRYYDPALGRPLQPNPAGAPPTVPQALNRFTATPMGQPGAFQAESNSLITAIFNRLSLARSAQAGTLSNIPLDFINRSFIVSPSWLVLRGSTAALENALGGKGIPFTMRTITKGGWLGNWAIRVSGHVPFVGTRLQSWFTQKWVTYEARTGGYYSLIEALDLEGKLYRFNQLGATVDTTGLRLMSYQRGMLFGEAGVLRVSMSVGVTLGIDFAFEGLEYATGTGRWGNPYWSPDQKFSQAGTAIAGDVFIVAAIAWWNPSLWVAIPAYIAATIVWNNLHPVIFPGQFVTTRNLAPLSP